MDEEQIPAGQGSPDEAGDVAADFGVRLSRQERRLRLLLFHLTGRALRARIEIDDLLQEVYVRAIKAKSLPLPSHDDPSETALWRYLSQLARHAVIDAARAIRTAKRAGQTSPLHHSDWSAAGLRASQILANTWGPATRVAANEMEERLVARYSSLATEHQRVIGLRQFEGLSAREAAKRMGRSETAVHSLYRRALLAWQGDEVIEDFSDESELP
ncbi:MAG: RNA polymerase sigma factor (sigma-70 family) [Planctomycetota bacterium]|jgi:RNA polymerase sigma factor (sigma-70 family)